MDNNHAKSTIQNSDKVSFFSSIKTRIVLMFFCTVAIAVLTLIFIIIPNVKSDTVDIVKNYMYDVTMLNGEKLQNSIDTNGADAALDVSNLTEMFSNVKVKGMSEDFNGGVTSSYAYVVSGTGTMLYHPTASKIGKAVENAAVKQVVAEIATGTIPEPQVIHYIFKGTWKYAAYYVTSNAEAIVIVTVDEDEALFSTNVIRNTGIYSSIGLILLFLIIGYVVANNITKPVNKLSLEINKLSSLDFTISNEEKILAKSHNETGVMVRAVILLQTKLSGTVQSIKRQSIELKDASHLLNENAENMSTTICSIEGAVTDIANNATTQADKTQTATANVVDIGTMISATSEQINDISNNTSQIRESSENAVKALKELDEINKKTEAAIDVISNQTNTTNASADKIRKAASLITSIADETNLLSLNAAIEAARAGEQGKGFAVVAAQIQKLAEQSNSSAGQIQGIINSLIEDSASAVKTMEEIKLVMAKQSENVIKTTKIFNEVKAGVDTSISKINKVSDDTQKIDSSRLKVIDNVQSLTAIAENNAASTEETSASITQVSTAANEVKDLSLKLKDVASSLEESMQIFKI